MRATLWIALCAGLFTASTVLAPADAAPRKKRVVVTQVARNAPAPRARVRVEPRSFLDLGTEVLPGERKYMDYAIPPTYSPYGVIENTAAYHRDPLPGPFDLPARRNPYPYQW